MIGKDRMEGIGRAVTEGWNKPCGEFAVKLCGLGELCVRSNAEEDPMPEMLDGNLTWENVKKRVVAATRKYVLT